VAGSGEETAAKMGNGFSQEFAGRTNTIAAARHFAAESAADLGSDSDLETRVALVVSELASNAVQASEETYSVHIQRTDGGDMVITVTNRTDAPDLPPRSSWGPSEPLATRGRGLGIVEHLASGVAVDVDPPSVTITAVLSPD
jgi:anti-sigma regulatory factor (Ser/Thr protein kinase)